MSDSMIELSGGARAILDAGRDGDGAGDLERARVRRALLAKIAIAGGATLAASSTAAASGTAGSAASGAVAGSVAATGSAAIGPSAAAAFPLAKILVPLAIMIVGGVGGTVAWRAQQPASTTVPAAIVEPTAAAVPAVAPVIMPIEPATPAVAPRPAPAHHAHVVARTEAPTNRLAEETALLAASNAQLRGGDATRALKLLDDYDRRYPAGVLREEVLATRVIARCQLGLTPDASSRHAADTFLRRHPASPLASRVRSSCGH